MAQVVLENVYKSFPIHKGTPPPSLPPLDREQEKSQVPRSAKQVNVLRRINLTIQAGEFMVLVGPSGCGKSTLLRLIAGLEQLTGGNIWVGDRLVNDLPPKQRDIAMVFQNYALYPHLNVYNNLAFGLRRMQQIMAQGEREGDPQSQIQDLADSTDKAIQKTLLAAQRSTTSHSDSHPGISKTQNSALSTWAESFLAAITHSLPRGWRYWSKSEREIDQRVQTVAKMLQIEALLDRLPKQLSGGQKQRVALGRAMSRNPQVFLMDEPLSNLDAKLRAETRAQIVSLQQQLGTTTIYVTHDQTEAMTMGDRIAVMNAGEIQQIATPLELYNYPTNRFVAEFIGSPPMNFLPVQIKAPLLINHAQFRLTLPGVWERILGEFDGQTVVLGIRPEHLNVGVPAPKNLPVQVNRVEALGSETYLSVTMADIALQARIHPDLIVTPGQEIWLALIPDKIHLFNAKTGVAIFPT
ncbi:MAG: ABC transporter ATP-binding protein [Cyanothece sp. SIO1E1]|nr:ABC transporter ATP-binding protein [Cyanothece sp. SIO1E1]